MTSMVRLWVLSGEGISRCSPIFRLLLGFRVLPAEQSCEAWLRVL